MGWPEGDPNRTSIRPDVFSLRHLKEQLTAARKKKWQLVTQNGNKFCKQLNSLLSSTGSCDFAIFCKFLQQRGFKMSPNSDLIIGIKWV